MNTNTTLGISHSPKTLSRQRSFSNSPSTRCSLYFLITSTIVLTLLQIQSLKYPLPFSLSSSTTQTSDCELEINQTRSKLRDMVTFLPLKDLRLANNPMDGTTWFMSSINDTLEKDDAEHLHFPSDASNGRLLCLAGRNASNGTMNSYALAWMDTLPYNASLFQGLTFVSDTYYSYDNLWHGISALFPFVAWHKRKGCVLPARWVLYHRGELRTSMAPWVRTLMEAVFGEIITEGFKEGGGSTCFEEAVVFRHNQGSMSRERKEEVYDILRCKARAYCNISKEVGDLKAIGMTLLLRTGARSFKNESAVIRVFETECRKVDGCRLMVARPNNLTFCDQVRLMMGTDILVSPHGGQLTNMLFMDKNSSLMEFFPRGWLEMAGAGQYVFHWIATASGMRHQGTWRDSQAERCPYDEKDPQCFKWYKNRKIGHNDTFFRNWSASVLKEMKEYKLGQASNSSTKPQVRSSVCPCS